MDSCFFDATTVEPLDSGFSPVPEGDYEAMIVKSANKVNKKGTGSYLELQVQIISGEYAKRIVWARLNLKNPNPTSVEMAKRELASICYAVGVLKPSKKEDLHNIPMIIHVVQRDDDRGGKQNDIKGWKAKPAAAQAAQPAATASDDPDERPW